MRHKTVEVGDKVIYSPRNSSGYLRPIVTTVQRLTESGWPVIAEHNKAFRPEKYEQERWRSGNRGELFIFSEQRLAKLNEYADNREQAEREKQEEQQRQSREREERIATQTAEVKRVCKNALPIRSSEFLLDGSRFVLLDVPLHPHAEKQINRLIVRIRSEQEFGETGMSPVADSTYIGMGGGFTSRGSLRAVNGDTEDDLLWELVRDRYFDWR